MRARLPGCLTGGRQPELHAVGFRLYRKASSGRKSSCLAEGSQRRPGAGAPGAGPGGMLPLAARFRPGRFQSPRCSLVPSSGPAPPRRGVGAPPETGPGVSEPVRRAPASRRTRALFRMLAAREAGARFGPRPGAQSCGSFLFFRVPQRPRWSAGVYFSPHALGQPGLRSGQRGRRSVPPKRHNLSDAGACRLWGPPG